MIPALLIFAATYAAIGLGSLPRLKIDRPSAALIGGLAMIAFRVVPLDKAYASVHLPTLALLLGLMLLAASLGRAGFFAATAEWIGRRFSRPRALLAAVIVASGALSALFLNDAVCILFTPVVLLLARRAKLPPLPFLLGVATASNVGGACTITGNPQNALIGAMSGIPFATFALRLLPASILGLAIDWAVIAWLFRRELASIPALPADAPRAVDRPRLALTLAAAFAMLVAFLGGVDPSLAALTAGAFVLLLGGRHETEPFEGVDWTLLVLFAGLFVVTEGVRESGLAVKLLAELAPALAAPPAGRIAGVSAIALVLSNLVSNVPAVMLLGPPIAAANSRAVWLALAMSSTFAGNLTIVGSIANLIVAESARKAGTPIKFGQYLRVGLPLTLATTAIGILILSIEPP